MAVLVGTTVNRLRVIRDSGKRQSGEVLYLCECLDCGNETLVRSHRLSSGKAKSCGCKRKRGKVITRLVVDLGENDTDILEHLKSQDNKTMYVKDLIRADMLAHSE